VAEAPLLASAREPRDVWLLGLGTGITLQAILRYPVDRVDLCELSPEVIAACRRFFPDHNGRCLDDPRVHLHREDGRAWLALAGRDYDVVISEPSNPWMAGVASLFTLESFTTMRDALREGGVACQWVQGYLLGEERFRTILRTWLRVFPRSFATLSQLHTTDLLLVGWRGPGEAEIPVKRISRRIARRRPWPPGEPYEIKSPPDLTAGFLAGPAALARWAGPGPLHTDDLPRLQYEAPRDLFDRRAKVDLWPGLPAILAPPLDLLAGLDPAGEEGVLEHHTWLLLRFCLGDVETPLPARLPRERRDLVLRRLQALASTAKGGRLWLVRYLEGQYLLYGKHPAGGTGRFAPGYDRSRAIEAFVAAHQLAPDKLEPVVNLALTLERGDDGERGGRGAAPEQALPVARKALTMASDREDLAILVARLLFTLGRAGEAAGALAEFMAAHPGAQRVQGYLERLREIR
jgi:hypothetical protein